MLSPSLLETALDRLQREPVNADLPKADQGLTVGQFLLEQLSLWGVERIYGVIGDANVTFLHDIAKQRKIQYVPFLDENAAALAACAEAKLTGRIGVVLGTSGPGLTNMLNGLADAWADSAGVLAITGQVESKKAGTPTKQYIQQQVMMSPLASFSEQLAHPDALPDLLQCCLVNSGVTGGVSHLSIPKEMFQQRVKGAVYAYSPHFHQQILAPERDVEETFRVIADAKRPMLLLGRGAEGLTKDAVKLAEALGAAVTLTMPAKHLFPNDHELFVGGLGLAGSEAASVLMAESDLVVICGATWWPEEYTPPQARIVQIDAVREHIGIGHPLVRGLVGDLRQILPRFAQLSTALGRDPGVSPWRKRIAAVRGAWMKRLAAETAQEMSPLAPQRVMRVLSEVVPPSAVIALDTGDHTLWFNRCFENRGQRVLISGRWRTLGFAVPAAIAAKLAEPKRPVIAVAGDGGVMQTLIELKTAARMELPIVIVVVNNGAYAIEKNRMELAGLDSSFSMLDNPEFVELAKACGGTGWKAESEAAFREALHAALAETARPALIEVLTAPAVVPHTKA